MAKETVKSNQEDKTLPYGTSSDNIYSLIDAIKKKTGNEEAIKAIYSGSQLQNTKRTLEILHITNGADFDIFGRELAYETDEAKKRDVFLKIVLNYKPYEYFLTYLFQGQVNGDTDIETIKNYWGKNGYGSSQNNRDDAATLFCNFLNLAGLGNFKVGRRGGKTRLEWEPNAELRIKSILDEPSSEEIVDEEPKAPEITDIIPETNIPHDTDSSISKEQIPVNDTKHVEEMKVSPNITINVDMSDWGIDKISDFFKVAYGVFDDGTK